MAELKASPRSKKLGALSDLLLRAREYADKAKIPFTQLGLGELLIGKTPEEINEWSYGNAPFTVPEMTRVPQLKRGRGEQLLDTAFSAADVAGLTKFAPRVAKSLINRAVETGTRSPLAQAGAIKPRGGNWLPEGLPQVSNPTEVLRQHMPGMGQSQEELLKLFNGNVDDAARANVDKARSTDKWVQGALRKYIMRDMATPDDPIRRLADQGILHVDPQELNFNMSTYGKWPLPGQEFLAKSDAAKAWEGASDNSLTINPRVMLSPEPGSSKLSREHPWIDKLPENEPLYGIADSRSFMEDLGMDRLQQQVYEALLNGELTKEQLNSGSFSVEAAVRMAHQKRMAELARQEAEMLKNSRNAATFTHKEYKTPENTEGYHWVQIRPPDEGSVDDLQKALNHEGDVMGHCAGEYCDAVASGDTGIYSLRDKGGKSHVTIETQRKGSQPVDPDDPEVEKWIAERAKGYEKEYGKGAWDAALEDYIELRPLERSEDSIRQIKGSGKKDSTQAILPEDIPKFQPYIQDFLNSQPWSKVNDLKNAGLIDVHGRFPQYKAEAPQRFMTADELDSLRRDRSARLKEEFKTPMTEALDDPNFGNDWEIEF